MPEKLLSAKRLAANRANPGKSTCTDTPEGKAHASQNARKHQFRPGNFASVRIEDSHLFVKLTKVRNLAYPLAEGCTAAPLGNRAPPKIRAEL